MVAYIHIHIRVYSYDESARVRASVCERSDGADRIMHGLDESSENFQKPFPDEPNSGCWALDVYKPDWRRPF